MALSKNSVEEEMKDLSTCCVCMEPYNDLERKPKFLLCYHTYCLQCIKAMVPPPATQFSCPKCKRDCVVSQEEAEGLPTNPYAMNLAHLRNTFKNKDFWCLDCGAIPKAACEGRHKILDRMEDVKEIMSLLAEVSGNWSKAIEKRQQTDEFLQAAIASNGDCLETLRSMAVNGQLSASKTGGALLAKKELETILQQSKQEADDAAKVWNDVTGGKKNLELGDTKNGNSETKKRTLENRQSDGDGDDGEPLAAGNSRSICSDKFYKFPSNKISAERLSSSQPLKCRDLIGQHGGLQPINVVEFSDDGSLFVSGGRDGRILLWPTSKAVDEKWKPESTEMETKHDVSIWCLAISPDNRRIFSGGSHDNKLLLHDVETRKLLFSFEHPDEVNSISLQPGTNGKNFATACGDGNFRLFDVRRSTTDAVCQSTERPGILRSVMFSPAEPNVLVATGSKDGALLYDIRQPKSCLFSFPNEKKTVNAKFDSSGKRLLCLQRAQLVVYDLPTLQHPIVNGNVILMAPDFSTNFYWYDSFGFAGLNDELVVAASNKNNELMIWALPEGRSQQDRTVDQPLQVLQGHNGYICNVRYSNEASAIVSSDNDGVIKLWTPGVPLHQTT